MKKLILSLLCLLIGASFSLAAVVPTGEVADVPQTGLFETHLSKTQTKGAFSVIGGNEFQFVYNDAGMTLVQGDPVFWKLGDADAYSVTTYETSAYYDAFAGIVHCNQYGGTTAEAGNWVWIQTRGVGYGYVSKESTNIAVGSVLSGYSSGDHARSSTPSTGGSNYLGYDHASYTSSTGTSSTELSVLNFPKALQAYTTTSAGLIRIWIRP